MGACPEAAIAQTVRPARPEDPFKQFRDLPPQPAPLLPTEIAWTLTLPSLPSAGAAMDAERIYVPLRDARLVALDRESGAELWSRTIYTTQPPLVSHGLVLVWQGAALRALDAVDGRDRWLAGMAAPPMTALATRGDRVIAAIEPGLIVALHVPTGEIAWQTEIGAPSRHAPVLSADTIFLTTTDGRLMAFGLADGRPRWEQKIPGTLSAPATADDRVYVGSTDNALYAFDTVDGASRWRMNGGGDVIGIAVDQDLVYFVSLDNIVRALNQGNGNQRWREATGTRPQFVPLAFGDLVVVPGVAPAATVFNARTGATVGTLALAQGTLLAPPLVDRVPRPFRTTIVTLTREGTLEAWKSVPLLYRETAPVPITALPGRPLTREALR